MLAHSLLKMPKHRLTTAPGDTTGAKGQMAPLHPQSGSRSGDAIFFKDTIVLALAVGKHLVMLQSTISHILLLCNCVCMCACVCVHVGMFVFMCKETKGWCQCLPNHSRLYVLEARSPSLNLGFEH